MPEKGSMTHHTSLTFLKNTPSYPKKEKELPMELKLIQGTEKYVIVLTHCSPHWKSSNLISLCLSLHNPNPHFEYN